MSGQINNQAQLYNNERNGEFLKVKKCHETASQSVVKLYLSL